jgi:hypothetical protein
MLKRDSPSGSSQLHNGPSAAATLPFYWKNGWVRIAGGYHEQEADNNDLNGYFLCPCRIGGIVSYLVSLVIGSAINAFVAGLRYYPLKKPYDRIIGSIK